MKNKKDKKWIKKRHVIARNIAYALLYPYARMRYHIKVEKFKEQGDRQYLILLNHQTPFDQFFVGMAFSGAVYYLATEDIFSNGWISSVIRFLVAPIPIKKQTTDIAAIKACLRVVKEGGTVCIAPEGNRTYSGKTEYMSPTIAALAKKLGLPIALFRIEGGYGAEPRWSDVIRRGEMRAYVSRVIEPEEYAAYANEELFSVIRDGLYVNEAKADVSFYHKKRAEYLERAMYVCPFCGLSVFESQNEHIMCKKCGATVEYRPTKELVGVGCAFPFRFVNDWYEYQKDFVRHLDVSAYIEQPMYRDTVRLSEVIVRKRKNTLCKEARIALFGDRIEIDGVGEEILVLPFADIAAVTVLGKNKLNLYFGDTVYQCKGDKRFNALKYVNIFYHSENIRRGDHNGEFLGI